MVTLLRKMLLESGEAKVSPKTFAKHTNAGTSGNVTTSVLVKATAQQPWL